MRMVRTALHLTQEEFARVLGVSKRTVIRWEQGSHLPWPKHHNRHRQKFFEVWDTHKEWIQHEYRRDDGDAG